MRISTGLFFLFCGFAAVAQSPKFAFERIEIDGKPSQLKENKTILLSLHNSVLIETNRLAPDSVVYLYRLRNLDSTWTQTNYPSAHYQNLEAGLHFFEIKAKTPHYQTKTLFLRLNVDTPFWQKSWFGLVIMGYVLFLGSVGLYFFLLYNLRQRLKLHNIRNNIAADLHDEVGSNLSSIAILVELLRKKSPAELRPILDKITANSVESVQLMQDTIWAVQAKNDDFEKFIERMKSFAVEVLAAKNIALTFNHSGLKNKLVLPMEQRKNTYLIFKEAINNVAKHSKATKVNVEFRMADGGLKMTILDNGRGFDPTQSHQGNGLKNFETRAEASEIRLKVSSEIGKGTQIVLLIPF